MEKEHDQLIDDEHFENPKEFWGELLKRVEDEDPSGVEHMLLNRGSVGKLPGEDEIWAWLQGMAENKLGRKLLVELDERGMIVPIESQN